MKTVLMICLLTFASMANAIDNSQQEQSCSTQLTMMGGGSSIGPGSPKWQYSCSDAGKNIHVTILRTPPNYDNDQIAVQTVVPMSMHIEKNIVRKIAAAPGGALVFEGQRFVFSVMMDAPVIKDGKAYFNATLTDRESWEPTQKLNILCESM